VHTLIAPIFVGIDRSMDELSNSGEDLLNRGWEEVDLRLGGRRHVWFMEEIPEGLGRTWRCVLSLMSIGKTWVLPIFEFSTDLCDQFF
jgi:hypothetical protein